VHRSVAGRAQPDLLAELVRRVVLGIRHRQKRLRAGERRVYRLGRILRLHGLAVPIGGCTRQLRKTDIAGQCDAVDVHLVGDPFGRIERLVVRHVRRARRAVDQVVPAHLQGLGHGHRDDREILVRLEEHADASASKPFRVDVVRDTLHRRRDHIAARRPVHREGVHHDAVDPAVAIQIAADDAHGKYVADRQVEHQVAAAVAAAAVGVGAGCLGAALEHAELRLVADDLDRAAHRSRSIQRALRPAQHLDAIDIIEVRIDHDLAGLRQRGRRQRHFVEIEADRGRGAARRGKAARLELRETGSRRTHREARNVVRDLGDARDAGGHQLIAAQRGHADWRVLDGGFVLLRRDDDFLDRARRSRLGRSLLGTGCMREDCRHTNRQNRSQNKAGSGWRFRPIECVHDPSATYY
jgi:hypothetical protein